MGVLAEAITGALARKVSLDVMSTRSNLDLPVFRSLVQSHRDHVRLFYPAFPLSRISELGSHAKFCIRDEEAAYVGSANLTAPALGGTHSKSAYGRQHFEMGVLIRGDVAAQLHQLWVYTVRYGMFLEFVPEAS